MCNQIAVELDRHQFFRDGNATFSLRADGLGRWRRRWLNTASATDKASVGRYRLGGLVMRILPLSFQPILLSQAAESMGVEGKVDNRLYRNVCFAADFLWGRCLEARDGEFIGGIRFLASLPYRDFSSRMWSPAFASAPMKRRRSQTFCILLSRTLLIRSRSVRVGVASL